jgi:hypothetical protein
MVNDINIRVVLGIVLAVILYYGMVFWALRMPPSDHVSPTLRNLRRQVERAKRRQ